MMELSGSLRARRRGLDLSPSTRWRTTRLTIYTSKAYIAYLAGGVKVMSNSALGEKMYRESVCYERNYRSSDGSGALLMMRVGPSKSACRRRFQTVASGVDQESSS